MEHLIKAQKEYIDFLEKELADSAVFLYVHNRKSSDEIIKKGEELRKNIENLTSPDNVESY